MKIFTYRHWLFLLLLLFAVSISSQEKPTRPNIIWPMEMRVPITGSFGEFRNHYSLHLGCDFKTYWMNGLPVIAPFDGYISYIRYSTRGYGLSMNLYSPQEKLTARIAHLSSYAASLPALKNLQEALQLLSPDGNFRIHLKPGDFPIKQGVRVARTGESGSGISHLHLELYDQKYFYNPLSFADYKQKDTTPPVLQSIYLDDTGSKNQWLPLEKISPGRYRIQNQKTIYAMSNIKLKLTSYDLMTARNHNGIYGLRLFIRNKKIFERKFDKLKRSQLYTRSKFYDTNHSSLSPTHYVYKLYPTTGNGHYSLRLNSLSLGQTIPVRLQAFDADGNTSTIEMTIEKGKPARTKPTTTPPPQPSRLRYQSVDKIVQLNFSGLKVKGQGEIHIEPITKLPADIPTDKLAVASNIYKINSNDFSWKGGARGQFSGDYREKKYDLYIYDPHIKQWLKLSQRKNRKYILFWLGRLGYLAVMKDKTPPKIQYPYLFYRNFNLPQILSAGIEEKFYEVHEYGAGIQTMQVLIDGQIYPYSYDRDRKFIKIEIPKDGFGKQIILIEIQVTDKAGNQSEWFTDLYTATP